VIDLQISRAVKYARDNGAIGVEAWSAAQRIVERQRVEANRNPTEALQRVRNEVSAKYLSQLPHAQMGVLQGEVDNLANLLQLGEPIKKEDAVGWIQDMRNRVFGEQGQRNERAETSESYGDRRERLEMRSGGADEQKGQRLAEMREWSQDPSHPLVSSNATAFDQKFGNNAVELLNGAQVAETYQFTAEREDGQRVERVFASTDINDAVRQGWETIQEYEDTGDRIVTAKVVYDDKEEGLLTTYMYDRNQGIEVSMPAQMQEAAAREQTLTTLQKEATAIFLASDKAEALDGINTTKDFQNQVRAAWEAEVDQIDSRQTLDELSAKYPTLSFDEIRDAYLEGIADALHEKTEQSIDRGVDAKEISLENAGNQDREMDKGSEVLSMAWHAHNAIERFESATNDATERIQRNLQQQVDMGYGTEGKPPINLSIGYGKTASELAAGIHEEALRRVEPEIQQARNRGLTVDEGRALLHPSVAVQEANTDRRTIIAQEVNEAQENGDLRLDDAGKTVTVEETGALIQEPNKEQLDLAHAAKNTLEEERNRIVDLAQQPHSPSMWAGAQSYLNGASDNYNALRAGLEGSSLVELPQAIEAHEITIRTPAIEEAIEQSQSLSL
jgi:hypothetical protein